MDGYLSTIIIEGVDAARDGALKIRVGDLLLFPGPELGEQGLDVRGLAHDHGPGRPFFYGWVNTPPIPIR